MNKGIEAQEILQIRQDFPLFRNDPVIYLDNSATTQKPDAVLNAVSEFYGHDNANPFRGIYNLSERATERYEAAPRDRFQVHPRGKVPVRSSSPATPARA
ncbi:MAG: aminotransferase class V-fold PLP-dependent enzyme [Evtepia sp.]